MIIYKRNFDENRRIQRWNFSYKVVGNIIYEAEA